MADDPGADLMRLRARLARLKGLHVQETAKAEAAGALLAQDSTFPRPRREVEEELRVSVEFDLPMLTTEIGKTEREIAALERLLGMSPASEAETVMEDKTTPQGRSTVIAEALTALQKRAVYARELATNSQPEGELASSLADERDQAERGVAAIEAGLAEVERCIADTTRALNDVVSRRAPTHELSNADGEGELMASRGD